MPRYSPPERLNEFLAHHQQPDRRPRALVGAGCQACRCSHAVPQASDRLQPARLRAQHRRLAPLILDTGCGVGLSTLNLAAQFPDHFVIGIDQSEDRLGRNTQWDGPQPDNLCFIRADLVDYWRLLLDARIFPARQYLLYPNPWPKIGHLARRWHGHAVFPSIVALGGVIECRSNWRIYVEEFAAALTQLSGQATACEAYATDAPITPFERKYLASAHALWRCRTALPPQQSDAG